MPGLTNAPPDQKKANKNIVLAKYMSMNYVTSEKKIQEALFLTRKGFRGSIQMGVIQSF